MNCIALLCVPINVASLLIKTTLMLLVAFIVSIVSVEVNIVATVNSTVPGACSGDKHSTWLFPT